MTGSIALTVVIAVCLIDALFTLAALHPRFNPRRAFRQRARRFRILARGQGNRLPHVERF